LMVCYCKCSFYVVSRLNARDFQHFQPTNSTTESDDSI
jgi:hypothetical protein